MSSNFLMWKTKSGLPLNGLYLPRFLKTHGVNDIKKSKIFITLFELIWGWGYASGILTNAKGSMGNSFGF
jgi:hypothetical protein